MSALRTPFSVDSIHSFRSFRMLLLRAYLLLSCAVILLAAGPIAAAITFRLTSTFMHPFRLTKSPEHHSIYTIRLDLHLYRDLGLRHFQVTELTSSPISLRELEFQMRFDRHMRQFFHLGPAEGDAHSLAVAFPIIGEAEYGRRHIFAVLSVHPPIRDPAKLDNFPAMTLHGYASVVSDHDVDISYLLEGQRRIPLAHIRAGDVLSIRGVFRELAALHSVLP